MEEALNFVCPNKDNEVKTLLTEKQLTPHKRKHDMVLCLNKPSQYSTDQTPTPTRFIRNCEAIGLFQDLQNVNPFDENFKKATEAVKKGEKLWVQNICSLGKPAGEDLHTPHVDLTDDTQSSNNGNEDDDVSHVIQSEADTSNESNSTHHVTSASLFQEARNAKQSAQDVRLFVRMPNGVLVQVPTIGNVGVPVNQCSTPSIVIPAESVYNVNSKQPELQPKPQQSNAASAAVKQKLKAALLKTGKVITDGERATTTSPSVFLSDKNSNGGIELAKKDKKVSSSTSGDEDCERKRKTLERNRIAAMRCREKRKKWVAELKDKYDKMCSTNEALVQEVSFLRGEVARLKGLLLSFSCTQNQVQDLTTVQVVPTITKKNVPKQTAMKEVCVSPSKVDPTLNSIGRLGREGLRLDIEGAKSAAVMDLDSPLVRKDEILSSVAPPTTPNEKLISFPELDEKQVAAKKVKRCFETEWIIYHQDSDNEAAEEKILNTVIQINPNALSKIPSAFS